MTDKEKIKEAGVMLIIKDGLILAISRRHDKTKFGLPGGKKDPTDPTTKEAAVRETKEETDVTVKDCVLIYERVELGDGPTGVDYYSRCYYAKDWEGTPTNSEEGEFKWLTAADVTADYSPFGDYNRKTLDVFKTMFPNVYIKGETPEPFVRGFGAMLPPEWYGKTAAEIDEMRKGKP